MPSLRVAPPDRSMAVLTTARRLAWTLTHGPVPRRGQHLRLSRRQPRCVRVEHLTAGRRPRPPVALPPQKLRRKAPASFTVIRPGVWKVSIATAGGRRFCTIHAHRAAPTPRSSSLHGAARRARRSLNAAVRHLAHADDGPEPPTRCAATDSCGETGSPHPRRHPTPRPAPRPNRSNLDRKWPTAPSDSSPSAKPPSCSPAPTAGPRHRTGRPQPALAARLPDGTHITTTRRR